MEVSGSLNTVFSQRPGERNDTDAFRVLFNLMVEG